MRSNHETIVVRKECETCGYAMRYVSKRKRWCKLCVAARLRERINTAVVRAKMAATRFENDCVRLAADIDAELARPTRYWEEGR